MRDQHQNETGCTGMRSTSDWIKSLGGRIDLSFEDPAGKPGDFVSKVRAKKDHFVRSRITVWLCVTTASCST